MEINLAGVDKRTKTESNKKEPFLLHSLIKNTHILPEETYLLSLERNLLVLVTRFYDINAQMLHNLTQNL